MVCLRNRFLMLIDDREKVNLPGNKDNREISKLPLRELKKILFDRGVDCKDCIEKEHYVEKVRESIHLPVIKGENAPKLDELFKKKANGETTDEINYDEVMKMFKNREEERKKTMEMLKEKGIDLSKLGKELH